MTASLITVEDDSVSLTIDKTPKRIIADDEDKKRVDIFKQFE